MKRQPWISSCRVVGDRWDAHCRELHVKRLLNTKSSIDMKPPRALKFKRNNGKRVYLERERQQQILSENNRMLKNLLEVDPVARRDRRTRLFSGAKVKKRSTRRSESKGSLNAATRRKRMEKISAENKHLLKRIINCAPTMSRSEWKQRERKHKRALRRLAENSTNRPRPMTAESAIVYHPNAIREPARGRRTRRRPKSASRARPSRSVLAGERSEVRQRPKTAMGRRRRARAAGAGERPLSARN